MYSIRIFLKYIKKLNFCTGLNEQKWFISKNSEIQKFQKNLKLKIQQIFEIQKFQKNICA